MGCKVVQVGNFDPDHSTENELRKALNANGCEVSTVQEGNVDQWRDAIARGFEDVGFVVWTRTKSELDKIPRDVQQTFVDRAHEFDVPVCGYHLDIWFDLKREREISQVPYFTLVDFMCTADGGHEEQFKAAGVNHVWFPPGVSEFECGRGTFRQEFAADVAFVGCWDGTYHKEWTHRFDLVKHLQRRGDVRFWPEPGKHAVRGPDLRDLYASVKVLVGDSCLVGPNGHYWSDRVPETLGRGGVLLHPHVEGMQDYYWDGVHLETWPLGDWAELDHKIDKLLGEPSRRESIADAAVDWTLKYNTYTVRMGQLIEFLKEAGYDV